MADPPASEEFIIDISSELPAADWPECCIYRVPELLRKVNEEAYTPKLISIGPFHHGRKELRDMEKHKERYFRNFLNRTEKRQEDLRKIIEDDEKNIRLCYSEDYSGLNGRDFVKMFLLDAIFIIELFLKVREQKKREDEEKDKSKAKKAEEEEDYILRKMWLAYGIYYDLLLLENQLPFFVLEKLYKCAGFSDSSNSCNHHEEGKPGKEHKEDLKTRTDGPIVELFRNYFTYYDRKRKFICGEVIAEPTGKEKTEKPIGEEVKHFTDLLRYLFCPQKMEDHWKRKKERWSIEGCMGSSKNKKRREYGTQFCATKLDDAGLKFNVKNDRRLLDITLPGCSGRFPCFFLSGLVACLPRLIIPIPFGTLICI